MPPGTRPSQALTAEAPPPRRTGPAAPRAAARLLCQITTRRARNHPAQASRRLEAQGRVQRVDGGYVYDTQSVDETCRALSADGVRRYMTTTLRDQAALADADHALKARPHGRGA